MTRPNCPLVAVDAIITRYTWAGHPQEETDIEEILLIERKNEPLGWSLPGGFVECGETIEQALIREMKEEVGIDLSKYNRGRSIIRDDPNRDPRGHVISFVYVFDWIEPEDLEKITAGDDAKNCKWFDINNLPDLAFDHKEIIEDYEENYF